MKDQEDYAAKYAELKEKIKNFILDNQDIDFGEELERLVGLRN